MKTIGLIGGLSWESSAQYYRIINQEVRRRLGTLHSAQSLMRSVDFGQIEHLQRAGDWDGLAAHMVEAARQLERGGADIVVLCSNTMHRTAPDITAAISIPMLHIADATAQAILKSGHRKVGLLGTAFTMEQDFYKGRLADKHGLDVIVPGAEDRAMVHRVIYEELTAGQILETSRTAYRAVIARLIDQDAEAIILGCTEIMLLVGEADSAVSLFDTTTLHALAAVEWAMAEA
jgi:aspartate racemase